MSHIDEKLLRKLEKLCRIRLTESEEKKFLNNLENILAYVDMLDEVDTEGVEPCNHVIDDVVAPLREDEPIRLLDRDVFLRGTPEHIGSFLKVPKVIKEEQL